MTTSPITPAVIASWLRLFIGEGSVVEGRALEVEGYRDFTTTQFGYFDSDHLLDLARWALETSARSKGVFYTLNPVNEQLLARCANRARKAKEGESTSDGDVLRRVWFYLDFDPVRKSGISATDAEKLLAREAAGRAVDYLSSAGWPPPILADSGNGYSAFYHVNLPADDSGLIKKCLAALAARFNTEAVHIDEAVFNPARITKVPGTWARKGDPVGDRIHRQSRLIDVPGCPSPFEVAHFSPAAVPPGLLEELAAQAPAETPKSSKPAPKPASPPPPAVSTGTDDRPNHVLDVEKWLTARRIGFVKKERLASGGRTVWNLEHCPFDTSHTGKDCAIMQAPSGAMSVHCFHNSCGDRHWQDFKAAIGEPDGDHYDPPLPPKRKKTNQADPPVSGAAVSASARDNSPLDPFTWLKSYGIHIVKVIRIGGKRGDLDVILEGGQTVQLGTTACALSPKDCQVAFADAIGVVLPNLKRDDWRPIAIAIINAAELQDVGSDPQQELKAWITAFAESFAPLPANDVAEVVTNVREIGIARETDGTVYLNLVKFMANLAIICGARVDRADLLKRLHRERFTNVQPGYRTEEKIVKTRAWRSPPNYLDDQ